MSPPTEDLTMTRPLASSGTRQMNLNLHKKVGIDPFQSFKLGKGKVSLRGMFEKWTAETGYSATHRSWKERFWNENELGDGQGGLVCCDSWGHKELDTTERLNWTEGKWEHPKAFSCWAEPRVALCLWHLWTERAAPLLQRDRVITQLCSRLLTWSKDPKG